ncbi:MAG: AraC family transcriptional regulator [Bacteroidota bacterium]
MQELKRGHFYGALDRHREVEGLLMTEATYTHSYVDWHYHERPYFTFLLAGALKETNRKDAYHCVSGDLLFHNWQEAHCNHKPPIYTRGFHLELDPGWLAKMEVRLDQIEGNRQVIDPLIRWDFFRIYHHFRTVGTDHSLDVEVLVCTLLHRLAKGKFPNYRGVPEWAQRAAELLADSPEDPISIRGLADQVGVHPVHLSRDFAKYFGCNPGAYRKRIRLQQATSQLSDQEESLTQIAYAAGFSDQSHFGRVCKQALGRSPKQVRRLLEAG